MWKETAKATMFPTLYRPETLVPQTSALRDSVLKRGLQNRSTNIDPHLSLEPDVWSAPLTLKKKKKKPATNNTLIYYSGNMLLSLKSDDMKLNQLPVLLWIILTVPVAQRGSCRENKCNNREASRCTPPKNISLAFFLNWSHFMTWLYSKCFIDLI